MALYGNVSILRVWCIPCERYAFVIDQRFNCCRRGYNRKHKKQKRMSQPVASRKRPSKRDQLKILERQQHRCLYCDLMFGSVVAKKGKASTLRIHWDHLVPFSYGFNNKTANFVAACHICNGIKSSRLFDTIEEARDFILARWLAKGIEELAEY